MKKTYPRLSKSFAKFAIGFLLITAQFSFSQAVNYGFSQHSGAYSELMDATVLATATSVTGSGSLDSEKYSSIALPFAFPFAGNNFTNLTVHSDGFISFGATSPNGSTPLSNT